MVALDKKKLIREQETAVYRNHRDPRYIDSEVGKFSKVVSTLDSAEAEYYDSASQFFYFSEPQSSTLDHTLVRYKTGIGKVEKLIVDAVDFSNCQTLQFKSDVYAFQWNSMLETTKISFPVDADIVVEKMKSAGYKNEKFGLANLRNEKIVITGGHKTKDRG